MNEPTGRRNQPCFAGPSLFTALFLSLLALEVGPASAAAVDRTEVVSPNGAVRIEVLPRSQDRLSWRVTFRDKPVIETSAMTMLVDQSDVDQGVELGRPERYEINEKYPWRGVHSEAVSRGNGAKIPLTHTASESHFILEVRAFNDGVAFRHVLPKADTPRLPDEATGFVLPAGSTVWYHGLGGHYEAVHERKSIADRDKTIVLPMSEIGEVAAFARRSGKTWFLAILNGPAARTLQVPLSFLGRGEHQAMIVRDRQHDPAAVTIENATARRGDSLKIELSEGGGFIARFSRN